jgi:phosphopantothenoylcysteine decarboxylase/phosphopantothenate--cysteine ligase
VKVLLGVAGGIAAYKAAELVRVLRRRGAEVTVVPTAAALRFVGAATFEALSGNPVRTDLWSGVEDVPHVRLGGEAELIVVAPATADLLARAAHGLADDLLTNTLLTATCPVLLAPAMHTEMWRHRATAANVALLRSRGVTVLEPDDGPLTSGDSGRGRLPEPTAIADAAYALLRPLTGDLAGRHLVVSAGGTREALDPVRFLGNRSSGRQGWAIARAALARGARVTLVAANVAAEPDLADPPGAQVVRVGDTAELRAAVLAAADAGADVIVMAAAVADFRPATDAAGKLKKPADGSSLTLELVQNPDVLAELGAADRRGRFPHQVLVGFAAETDPDQGAARAKLARKGADLLVLNEVGPGLGFEVATNAAVVLDRDGGSVTIGRTDKLTLAHRVLDRVVPRLS